MRESGCKRRSLLPQAVDERAATTDAPVRLRYTNRWDSMGELTMPNEVERAKRYRDHAEELRTMAQDWRDMGTLKLINDLARDYDKMAAELEVSLKRDEPK